MGRTILHVAVASRRERIVEELLSMGNDEELDIQKLLRMQDKRGYTALALAAELTDNKDVAEWMIHKGGKGGKDLLSIKTEDKGEIPILLAAAKGHKRMTRYLFSQTSITDLFENRGRDAAMLLTRCITAEMFDIAAALLLQDRGPIELTHETKELRPINALAHMPSAFRSGTQLGWKRFIYKCLRFGQSKDAVQTSILRKLGGEKIYEMKWNHHLVLEILERLSRRISELDEPALRNSSAYDSMLHAAKYGIVEFINSMRQANPDLLWAMDKNKRGIFSHAICYRKEKVFRLIHEIEGQKEKIATHEDVLRNNMLHLVAELGPSSYLSSISNSALQMQRELQWFKAVERIVPPKCKEARNADGKKPHELFTKTHEELKKAGEKWARDTATSFTIVGTLIITIMFAAAFTVPGGNDQSTGIPIFLKKPAFTVFIIADAISLVMSSSSVLIFIGILSSRYAEKDFLLSLPLKLLFGLLTLFLSVTFMMVSFVSALFMMLKGYQGVEIAALVVLGVIPVLVLIPTILSLSLEIWKSTWTWGPNFLASKKKKSED